MNIKNYYNGIPKFDKFLSFYSAKTNPNLILPNLEQNEDPCICIYGVSESSVSEFLSILNNYCDGLISEIKTKIDENEAWDLKIKPVFLFDTEKSLLTFLNFANGLNEEMFFEMIDELQLAYNEPWGLIKQLNSKKVCKIIRSYE